MRTGFGDRFWSDLEDRFWGPILGTGFLERFGGTILGTDFGDRFFGAVWRDDFGDRFFGAVWRGPTFGGIESQRGDQSDGFAGRKAVGRGGFF